MLLYYIIYTILNYIILYYIGGMVWNRNSHASILFRGPSSKNRVGLDQAGVSLQEGSFEF